MWCRLKAISGIDYGIKRQLGSKKKFLVLEGKPYSYQNGLSDCSGVDVSPHHNNQEIPVNIIRDRLVTNNLLRSEKVLKPFDMHVMSVDV